MINSNLLDLHTHSVLSNHAYSSLTENIEYAQSIGLKIYGISEHQYDSYGVGTSYHIAGNIVRIVPKSYKGMVVLKGIELNILDNGFDVSKYGNKIYNFDYTIASMHSYAYSKTHTEAENTSNYLKACDTDYISIIGHMDYINFKCDYEEVIKHAKSCHKLIELNNSSLDPGSFRVGARDLDKNIILPLCIKHKCPIIVNSDAHIKYQIGDLNSAFELLTEIDFPEELVVNLNENLFRDYIDY